MDMNVFSLFNLDNTKAAIAELQLLALCGLCNDKALDPICLGTCDHFFCSHCLKKVNHSVCPVCKIPSPPHARGKDNVVIGLLSASEDLLKIFNGEMVQLESQGIESPCSYDQTKPYCSKTPAKPIKLMEKPKTQFSKKISNIKEKKGNLKKQTAKLVTKSNKENCDKINTPMGKKVLLPKSPFARTILELNKDPTTPKNNTSIKQELTPAINKRNAKGETSLHSWCIKGNLDKVKTLLDEGANPNTRDNAGWTPLHEASSHGFLQIAELLLQKGALVNVPGNNNETALHDAVGSSNLPMICLLRKWGANPNLKDTWGRTPRVLADGNASQDVREAFETPENPDLVSVPKQWPVITKITIMDSNLTPDYKKKLLQVSRSLKIRLVHEFCFEVTHMIVMCNENGLCDRTVKYMTAVASGKTIISNKWIDSSLAVNEIANFLHFEVTGTNLNPCSKAPEKARQNTLLMNPNLFNGCHIYFQGVTNESHPSKKELETLIKFGGGNYLIREPNPESIADAERTIPFHYSSSGRLSNCSHFCLYKDGDNEPLMKYDMPHLKSLPLSWLFQCVDNFKIID